jgi:uncharacterized protein (DUF2336 family)
MRFGGAGLVGRIIISMSEPAAMQELKPVTAVHPSLGEMAAGQPVRRQISADSFKKLTALLKKPLVVSEPAPVVLEQAEVTPQQIVVEPAPIVAPEIAPIALVPLILPEPVIVAAPDVVLEPEPILMIEPVFEAPKPAARKYERPKPRDAFALPPSALLKSKPVVPVEALVQTPAQEQETAELARSLLDMMASGASSGLPHERALAADTLLRMLPRLPLKSLIMLAERLCLMEAPPQLLVAKLICDSRIEVAGPLLEECMHITDEDLTQVILEGTTAKNRMMARRRRISRAISSQLIRTHEPSVLLTLARNVNAEIPHESFNEFVELAAQQSDLLAPLCIRPDLPVPYAFELFWPAPAQLRRYLLSRFLTDSETLTKILRITLDTAGDEPNTQDFPNPEDIVQSLQLAAEGKQDDAANALAGLAKIEPGTAARILADQQGDALAALLKAAGMPRFSVAKIFEDHLSRSTILLDHKRDPEELQSLFDSLSFNKARILLTYWDWSTTQSGPYAPLN